MARADVRQLQVGTGRKMQGLTHTGGTIRCGVMTLKQRVRE